MLAVGVGILGSLSSNVQTLERRRPSSQESEKLCTFRKWLYQSGAGDVLSGLPLENRDAVLAMK
jgi:hypothetical protein